MIILSIDTSCDDTCIAILKIEKEKTKVLSSIISSQVNVHQKYGGVYPSLAKREHEKNLVPVLKQAIQKAKRKQIFKKPDLIAVTIGPGLEPCLWVGLNFAKSLSFVWNIPLIPVNHIEGHIFANWLEPISSKSKVKNQKSKLKFEIQNLLPAVCLVVSGGHTQLILMKEIGKGDEDKSSSSPTELLSIEAKVKKRTKSSSPFAVAWEYKIIGETKDDAAGECFDKTARILGLPYPGGPSIAKMAIKIKNQKSKIKIKLPRPMMYSKDYDFSFSGLKTAVLYDFKKRTRKVRTSKEYIREMAKEIQQAIIDVLIKKTIKSAKDYKAKTVILGGGVAANKELQRQFKEKIKKEIPNSLFLIPNSNLCTDNAAMIGTAGYFNKNKVLKNPQKIKVNSNLRI